VSDEPTETNPPTLPPPPTAPPVAAPGAPPGVGPTPVAEHAPPKPKRPRPAIGLTGPNWIRPAFYYVACLLGILLASWGALNTAQGVVHLISPDLAQQGDPISRLASTAVNVIDAGITAASDEFDDQIEDAGGEEAIDGTSAVLYSTRDELRSEARKGAVDELIKGLILLGIGLTIYRYHWLRVEPEEEPGAPPADEADLAAP
jgi:hypothetical protein